MKKYISLLALALVFGVMTSCDSDPSDTDTNPGGTAVKKMCGDWIVTAYTCENQGDVANIDNWEWEELGSFEFRNGEVELDFRPFDIRTFKVRRKR